MYFIYVVVVKSDLYMNENKFFTVFAVLRIVSFISQDQACDQKRIAINVF